MSLSEKSTQSSEDLNPCTFPLPNDDFILETIYRLGDDWVHWHVLNYYRDYIQHPADIYDMPTEAIVELEQKRQHRRLAVLRLWDDVYGPCRRLNMTRDEVKAIFDGIFSERARDRALGRLAVRHELRIEREKKEEGWSQGKKWRREMYGKVWKAVKLYAELLFIPQPGPRPKCFEQKLEWRRQYFKEFTKCGLIHPEWSC